MRVDKLPTQYARLGKIDLLALSFVACFLLMNAALLFNSNIHAHLPLQAFAYSQPCAASRSPIHIFMCDYRHSLPVSKWYASRYFLLVSATTSSGIATPSLPFRPDEVNQSRRYCLS